MGLRLGPGMMSDQILSRRWHRPFFAALLVAWSAYGAPAYAQAPGDPKDAAGVRSDPQDSKPTRGDIRMVQALEAARSFYPLGRYDECVAAFADVFLDPEQIATVTRPEREIGRVYYSACLLALGDTPAADAQMRAALADNPLMESPDPVVFPSQVRDLFFRVKGDFLEEVSKAQAKQLEQARKAAKEKALRVERELLRVRRLEQLAAQESLVHVNQRWLASVPFGVGQFQNDNKPLGALLLTLQTGLLVATAAGVASELGIHSDAAGGRSLRDAQSVNEALETARTLTEWAGGAFLLTAVLGIIEANVNFVPLRRIGERPREQLEADLEPSLSAQVVPLPGGVAASVSGTF